MNSRIEWVVVYQTKFIFFSRRPWMRRYEILKMWQLCTSKRLNKDNIFNWTDFVVVKLEQQSRIRERQLWRIVFNDVRALRALVGRLGNIIAYRSSSFHKVCARTDVRSCFILWIRTLVDAFLSLYRVSSTLRGPFHVFFWWCVSLCVFCSTSSTKVRWSIIFVLWMLTERNHGVCSAVYIQIHTAHFARGLCVFTVWVRVGGGGYLNAACVLISKYCTTSSLVFCLYFDLWISIHTMWLKMTVG